MKAKKQKPPIDAVAFLNWCVKQGKVKIYFKGHTPRSLFKDYKNK